MNSITASHKNKRERLAEAMRIEWNGLADTYSSELRCELLAALFQAKTYGGFVSIWFGGLQHDVTLTQLEDLSELVRASYHDQQSIKAGK